MNTNRSKVRGWTRVALALALPLAAGHGFAAEVWLKTGTTTVMGVPMWGYAQCTDSSFGDPSTTGTCGPVTVPGPALTVPPGDPGLMVHLKNTLPAPTSLVIPGQVTAMSPVWVEPATVRGVANPAAGTTYAGGSRPAGNLSAVVRSFTAEAAALNGTADYTWANLKPGTYLYESGTHPQVQVQMGLYGSVVKDTDAGNVAYRSGGADIVYSQQVTLLYSEIDPALHAAVAGGTYGSGGPTSTLEYAPKYFLINGVSAPHASLVPVATVQAAQNTLVRFLNASLKSHVPTINGQYWRMIAEDGNPYPVLSNPRQQYTAFLTAGKTMDVLLVPTNSSATETVRHAIFDSRLFDTTNAVPGGGLLAYVDVTPAAAAAPVFDSSPVTTGAPGAAYSYRAHATDPNGDVVSYALNAVAPAGMAIDPVSGQITWTPAAAGNYPVSVRASDGTLSSNQPFTVAVTAAATNNPPTATNDTYTAVAHPALPALVQGVAAPGVLANDVDPEGSALHTTAATTGRVSLAANGGFQLAAGGAGVVSFTYTALDSGNAASGLATVTINVVNNRAPTAFADAFSVPRCNFRLGTSRACRTGAGFYVPTALNLVSNDSDPDAQTIDAANQLPLAVARVRAQTTGTNTGSTSTVTTASGGQVTISGGTVTYVPPYNFAGTDAFQYRVKDKIGLESGATAAAGWATVSITVQ
jgi:hypothetical protein